MDIKGKTNRALPQGILPHCYDSKIRDVIVFCHKHVTHAQLNKGFSKCNCLSSRELAFTSLPRNTTVATSENMAQNTYGKLSEFDLNSTGQGWTEYCEQMEYYFSANAITDGKQKKAILLASVGNDTFKLIRNLFGQEDLKAETTTLENIGKRVKDHLSPKPNYIFARSDFFD